ncbi:hypothetical protein CDAR_566751 [Caerostris darwini]|uniref:Uncharacterized protein n=1 Tax=Caerostris darwini TaxID=1538125 RepID=A0AAV4UDU7_9ARAC|nr:hypothetical protein CDAR_566751 [Caerostris darwini]
MEGSTSSQNNDGKWFFLLATESITRSWSDESHKHVDSSFLGLLMRWYRIVFDAPKSHKRIQVQMNHGWSLIAMVRLEVKIENVCFMANNEGTTTITKLIPILLLADAGDWSHREQVVVGGRGEGRALGTGNPGPRMHEGAPWKVARTGSIPAGTCQEDKCRCPGKKKKLKQGSILINPSPPYIVCPGSTYFNRCPRGWNA